LIKKVNLTAALMQLKTTYFTS